MSSGLGIAFGVVLLVVNAFFVGAEFAVISARRSQIEPRAEAGSKAAKTTLWAMENVSLMLACAQLGITVCSLGLLAITEPALHHALEGPLHAVGLPEPAITTIALVVAVFVVGYLHIVAGEMIPKNISLSIPDRAALLLVPALVGVAHVVKPLIVALNWAANTALKAARVPPKDEVSAVYTLEEVRSLVDASQREGLLDDTHDVLTGSLTFGDRRAADVMVPLDQVVTLPEQARPHDVEDLVARTGYSRYPVHSDSAIGDTVSGYLHLQDVLHDPGDQPVPPNRIRPLARVRDQDRADDVLAMMQRNRTHLVAVVDQQEHVTGVLFFEDVLEELVGEIKDMTQVASTPDVR
ncbi:MAG: DUF21 domain-containing protein [Streptosporangiales bacterium]|nr:DUF21 domain-containing protein [Streptosporangiales bacterium]